MIAVYVWNLTGYKSKEHKDKAKICLEHANFMDEYVAEHLRNLYGLNPDTPHIAFQFPRLPPGMAGPISGTYQDPTAKRLADDVKTASKRLQGFQEAYQRYAKGLFAASPQIIPPNHPLYRGHDSIGILKAENEKLLKENIELRKKIDGQTKD